MSMCAFGRSLYITMDDRSSWDSLTAQVVPLIKQLTREEGPKRRLTLVAESFGGCLAFRLALAVPDLIANMVVVNSATCFDKSYSGVVNLIAASNLLSLFPQQLYQVRPPSKHVNAAGGSTHGFADKSWSQLTTQQLPTRLPASTASLSALFVVASDSQSACKRSRIVPSLPVSDVLIVHQADSRFAYHAALLACC